MNTDILKKVFLPRSSSHKGQNGRLLIIGGSHLFHSASLWALEIASRMVDLVHYSSVEENNIIIQKLKEEFRNGIVVSRCDIEDYIMEDDCILIGPGMVRTENQRPKIKNQKYVSNIKNLKDIEKIENEGVQTYLLTKYLLQKYPQKKWVIDAGALQMMDVDDTPQGAILTPHKQEFSRLMKQLNNETMKQLKIEEQVTFFAKKYNCTVLLKGEKDIIASADKLEIVEGGNAGMTKGGTGDVLAGLVAGLYCQNDAYTSAFAASYINKKAGEELYKTKGYWFNASDLADQIPQTMKTLLLSSNVQKR